MSLHMQSTFNLILLAVCFAGAARSETEKPMTVCGVLSNIDVYRGKIITVRGVFSWTTHGWTLSNNDDFRPCKGVEDRGQMWPGAIYLRVYESEMERIQTILSQPRKILREHNKQKDKLSITATFTGELGFDKDVRIVRNKDGSYTGSGYGQAGQFPAFLMIKDVHDVRLVKKGSED